jgi:hypothetical protein
MMVVLSVVSFGLSLVFLPVTLLPVILGGFEIYYGLKLMSSNDHSLVEIPKALAIFQIATFIYGNLISGVVGIIALIYGDDPEVQGYFNYIRGGGAMQPPPPPFQQ